MHPYGVSLTVGQSLASGTDHLLMLAHQMSGEDGTLHAFAPFTLARAAIETAAAALWVVGPTDPAQRRTNLLRWEFTDRLDYAKIGKHLGRTEQEHQQDMDEVTRRVREVADKLGIRVTRMSSTEMLEADHVPTTGLPAVAAWSAASGYAHGRPWAPLTMSEAIWTPSATPGVQSGRITADARILFWFVNTAYLLRNQAEQRAQELGSAPRPSAAAWRVAASR